MAFCEICGDRGTCAFCRAGTVRCADNGGCGECACECHTDVPVPGPHLASCKFSDQDYVPPDFERQVRAAVAKREN